MSLTMTIEVPVSFAHPGRGNPKELGSDADAVSLPLGRVPRVTRLMALALRLDELVRTGDRSLAVHRRPLLSMEAGAMGVTKDALVRELFLASLFTPNDM
jgi:hypothetical protein